MAKSGITKETLEYLAELARIRLQPDQEDKLLQDLQKILEYVSELQSVDTAGVPPMNGGTMLANIFREDSGSSSTNRGEGANQFPESKNDYLKVPAVFGGSESTATKGPANGSKP